MPKDCPSGKERNDKGNCVKKCEEGSTRHKETQRCRKDKLLAKPAQPAQSKKKRCPNGSRRIKGECVKNVPLPLPVRAPLPPPPTPSSSASKTVPIVSSSTTVPMKPSSSSSLSSKDSWNADIWPSHKVVPYKAHIKIAPKKTMRAPLGPYDIYKRFNKLNKEKFAKANPEEKRKMIEEYQVNPRNTDSSSYAVSGIEPSMYGYYNMLADKHKKAVLKQPVEKRMDFLNYIYALEHNRK